MKKSTSSSTAKTTIERQAPIDTLAQQAADPSAPLTLGSLTEPTRRKRKLSRDEKSERLIQAASEGDDEATLLWLSAGADVNYLRVFMPTHSSALFNSIGKCSASVVLALVDAGATLNLKRKVTGSRFSRSEFEELVARRGSLELMKAWSERDGKPTAKGWARLLINNAAERLKEISFWLKEAKSTPTADQWGPLLEFLIGQFKTSAGHHPVSEDESSQRVAVFLRDFSFSAPLKTSQILFGECVFWDHLPGLKALIEAGARPGEDWMGETVTLMRVRRTLAEEAIPEMTPLLSLAALGQFHRDQSSSCYALLKSFAPAVKSASEHPIHPNNLIRLSLKNGLAYAREGLPIDGVDEEGNTAAHAWARLGEAHDLKALLREHPELALKTNTRGQSAFEIALTKAPSAAIENQYRNALVSVEKKALMKESKKSAPKGKTRSESTGRRL